MRKVAYVLIICVLTKIQAICQPPAGRQYGGNMPADGTVSGKVVDGNNQSPIEYASIGLYRMRDSSLVTGMVTDSAGNFMFSNLQYGRFYADIKFLGYKKSRIKGILVTPNQKVADLGTVKLEGSATMLNQVEVTGNKSQIEYKLDKKVVNVGQQIAAAGGTAVDVLENAPSIQTDVEGNVTLRGSSSFTVLIDGKPSVLKGTEALQQIPASIIQQIEIITNPSAKYDPDGSAGIINIVMKKQKISGITGALNLSAGNRDKYNGDILINVRNSKVNYFVGADFTDFIFHMKGYSDQQITKRDTTSFLQGNTDGRMHRTGVGLKAGIDYSINDKNTISLSGGVSQRKFRRLFDTENHEFSAPANSDIYYFRSNHAVSPRKYVNGTIDYLAKLDKQGQQLTASVYYSVEPEGNTTDMVQYYTDSNWNRLTGSKDSVQQSTIDGKETGFRAKIEYTKPIGAAGKLEAGYQSRYETSNSDYALYNVLSEEKIIDPRQTNSANFIDHIEGAYVTISNKMKLFEYQLGIRGEYTDRNLKKKSGEEYPINRFDLFPTVHLSKQLPWDLQLMASYSRRVNRPDDRDLDPFITYINNKNIRQGNPGLKPEFGDSYELNLQKRMGEGFVSIEGYYKQTHDLIAQVSRQLDTITLQTVENFKRDYSIGTEAMLNMPFTKWWTFNASGTVYKYHIDGSLQDSTIDQNSTAWSTRVNSTFRLKFGMQIQLNLFYNGPNVTPQGKREAFSFTTIGIKQEFLKKQASLTLQVRDIFSTGKFVNTTINRSLYQYNNFKRESPVVMLTFSYRINNFKQQARRNNEDTNESDFGGGVMQ